MPRIQGATSQPLGPPELSTGAPDYSGGPGSGQMGSHGITGIEPSTHIGDSVEVKGGNTSEPSRSNGYGIWNTLLGLCRCIVNNFPIININRAQIGEGNQDLRISDNSDSASQNTPSKAREELPVSSRTRSKAKKRKMDDKDYSANYVCRKAKKSLVLKPREGNNNPKTSQVPANQEIPGISIDSAPWDQQYPLHAAARDGKFDIVLNLLLNDADETRKDEQGQIPLHWAGKCGRGKIYQLLFFNCPKSSQIKDADGKTPIQILYETIGKEAADALAYDYLETCGRVFSNPKMSLKRA